MWHQHFENWKSLGRTYVTFSQISLQTTPQCIRQPWLIPIISYHTCQSITIQTTLKHISREKIISELRGSWVCTHSVHGQAEQGCRNPCSSTSNKSLKICGFFIPRYSDQFIFICIIGIKIYSLKGCRPKNIYKISFPKSFQTLRSCNCLNELKKILLFTTNYVFQLKSFKWCNKSPEKST